MSKLLVTLAATLALAGCGGGGSAKADRPGLPDVYAQIATANCASLQRTFDRNMDRYERRDPELRTQEGNPGTVEFSYANAAQDRIEKLGC